LRISFNEFVKRKRTVPLWVASSKSYRSILEQRAKDAGGLSDDTLRAYEEAKSHIAETANIIRQHAKYKTPKSTAIHISIFFSLQSCLRPRLRRVYGNCQFIPHLGNFRCRPCASLYQQASRFLATLHQQQTDEQLQQYLADPDTPQNEDCINKFVRWSKLWLPKNQQMMLTSVADDSGHVGRSSQQSAELLGWAVGRVSPRRHLTLLYWTLCSPI
jgi:hypothetical protein